MPEEQKDPSLALRPALDQIIERQAQALKKLEAAIPADEVAAWALDVTHAAVGRIGEGIVRLLLHPDYSLTVRQLVADQGVSGRIFRGRLYRALVAVFARSLEEQARMSVELIPGMGIAGGRMPARATGGATVR